MKGHKGSKRRGVTQVVATMVGTVVVAPLLWFNVNTAGNQAGAQQNSYRATSNAVAALSAELPGRAIGTLSSEEVETPLLLAALSNGEELRSQASEARIEAERQAAEAVITEAQARAEAATTTTTAPPPPPTTTTTAPPPPPPAPAPTPGGPSAAAWAALRNCESGGNYGAVNPSGLYLGAYQFHQATWDQVARSVGRDDLVGVPANQADPASQDQLAQTLYGQRGASPWPVCGRHLR